MEKLFSYKNFSPKILSSLKHESKMFNRQNLSIKALKSYTGEGSASLEKLEKPVWRPKGRQLNKIRTMQITIMKINYCISQSSELSSLWSWDRTASVPVVPI